jgi:hypothetical protein
VEAGIFTQHRMRKGNDQRFRRMAEREVPRYEPCRKIDLLLPVERIRKGAWIVSGSVGKSSSGSPLSPGMRAVGTFR